jgi:Flp pilus assembly protein TadG
MHLSQARRGRTRLRPACPDHRDRGSVAVWTVVFAIAVLFLTALIVDGGIAMNARARATDIAGQAARAAADDINVPVLRQTGKVVLGGDACTAAASLVSSYAGQDTSGVDRVTKVVMGSCSPAADSATVQVTITTQPLIAGVLGGFTETATQTATAECGITQGVEC